MTIHVNSELSKWYEENKTIFFILFFLFLYFEKFIGKIYLNRKKTHTKKKQYLTCNKNENILINV